jgi:three-Cys-motif partner protein
MALRFDEIGYWSEIKLDIIKKYATEYSKIMTKQRGLYHVYIDAFAGAGLHVTKHTRELIPGSPINALLVEPPFRAYHLIDLVPEKIANLQHLIETHPVANRPNVHLYCGDCNPLLLQNIFPGVRYENYRRALCILDPYGLHLNWDVIQEAGRMRSIEVFLNFPIMDMNRNAIWHNPDFVDEADIMRMNAFWGDSSWREAAYRYQHNLLGQQVSRKQSNNAIVAAFRERLQTVAGFKYVPEPIPMRNDKRATVYYLFFASHDPTADKIASYLLKKYADPESSQAKMDL